MNWATIASSLVAMASVVATATVAIVNKRIDARTRREDRQHERVVEFEKRAADDKKAVLKALISAVMYVKRGARDADVAQLDASQRRAATLRELYEFRMRLGLDDGVAELMVYASAPVRELADLLLDEWDVQFREHGYSLTQLDSCRRQLALAPVDGPPDDITVSFEGERKWSELKKLETTWLQKLGAESTLDVDALIVLCDNTLDAAHRDLRGGYGPE